MDPGVIQVLYQVLVVEQLGKGEMDTHRERILANLKE